MESIKVLSMLVLLTILAVQCNARVGPYSHMEHAKHGFATKEEKAMEIVDHKQVIPSNQNAGIGNAGVWASKTFRLTFSLLTKGSPIPPSGPSRGHNNIPTRSHVDSSNSNP